MRAKGFEFGRAWSINRQASVILASFLINAASRDEPLPRMPLRAQPRPTDPLEYRPAD